MRKNSFYPPYAEDLADEPRTLSQIFPYRVLRELLRDYQITKAQHVEVFCRFLRFSSSLYLRGRRQEFGVIPPIDDTDLPKFGLIRPSAARAEFRCISDLALKLHTHLNQLSGGAEELFWNAQNQLRCLAPFADASKTKFGHTIIRREIDPSTVEIHFLKRYQILEAIEIARLLADHALARTPEGKPGAPRDEPLRLFVLNVQNFWTGALRRKFTRAFAKCKSKDGLMQLTPISDAARFCCALLQRLDPDIPPRSVETTMKALIQEDRERTGKIRS